MSLTALIAIANANAVKLSAAVHCGHHSLACRRQMVIDALRGAGVAI